MKILAIDPSGNFTEGYGTTGWSLLDGKGKIITVGQLLASNFTVKEEYWNSVLDLIDKLEPNYVVVEDYLLYAHQAKNQINSRLETPKLIGIIEFYCYRKNIPIFFQKAADVKFRWSDSILTSEGYVVLTNSKRYYASGVLTSEHIRDSIRHGAHFINYKLPKLQGEKHDQFN